MSLRLERFKNLSDEEIQVIFFLINHYFNTTSGELGEEHIDVAKEMLEDIIQILQD